MSDETYFPDGYQFPLGVTVYQPAVVFRAVEVCLDDDGTFDLVELIVVGIQATTVDSWVHRPIPKDQIPNAPSSRLTKDMRAAGFRKELTDDEHVSHEVLVWTKEFGISTTSFVECNSTMIVSAPKIASTEEWDAMIEEAKTILRRRKM